MLGEETIAEYMAMIEENIPYEAGDIEFKQLADSSMLIIKLSDGTYITGGILVYSLETFCKNKLQSTDTPTSLKVLCAAILEYGAS